MGRGRRRVGTALGHRRGAPDERLRHQHPHLAAAARLAVHQADLVEADRRLTEGMRVRPASTFVLPFLAVRGRLQLAKVFRARRPGRREALLREIDDVLRRRPRLGALADRSRSSGVATTTSAGSVGVSPLTPAELRLLPYLQTHLTIAEIADDCRSRATRSARR